MSVTVETNMGPLKIELFCEQTPKNCENFLALCASGYYNGCEFHRNIPGFIVQTGDPTNDGLGGESIWKRPYKDEIVAGLKHHARGIVSMANNGPDANGSQWFITYNKQESLDGAYTIIGHVIHGMDTLDKVTRACVRVIAGGLLTRAQMEKCPNDETDRPLRAILIRRVIVHANPLAE